MLRVVCSEIVVCRTFSAKKKSHETDHEWFHGKDEEEQNEYRMFVVKLKLKSLNRMLV
jgi:hypothetical protein